MMRKLLQIAVGVMKSRFTIFPGEGLEVMEMLRVPAR